MATGLDENLQNFTRVLVLQYHIDEWDTVRLGFLETGVSGQPAGF